MAIGVCLFLALSLDDGFFWGNRECNEWAVAAERRDGGQAE